MVDFEIIERDEEDEKKDEEAGLKVSVFKLNGDKYRVSTVNLVEEGMKGLLVDKAVEKAKEEGKYETSVFPYKEGKPDLANTLYSKRYKTKKEAYKEHDKILDKIKSGEIDLE
ncbi:MAG: hypothetical protein ACOCTT_00840 [archaeon]